MPTKPPPTLFAGRTGQPRRHWRGDAPARLCACWPKRSWRSANWWQFSASRSRACRVISSCCLKPGWSSGIAKAPGLFSMRRKRDRAAALARAVLARLDQRRTGARRATARGSTRCAPPAPRRRRNILPNMRRSWNETRRLHAPEAEVEAAILAAALEKATAAGGACSTSAAGQGACWSCLRLAPKTPLASIFPPAMLGVARAQLEKAGLRNVQLRQGDIYALPVDPERPSISPSCIRFCIISTIPPAPCARRRAMLAPGGRLIVVDFAPHHCEILREKHAASAAWLRRPRKSRNILRQAGLELLSQRDLAPGGDEAEEKLTVSLWLARDPRPAANTIAHNESLMMQEPRLSRRHTGPSTCRSNSFRRNRRKWRRRCGRRSRASRRCSRNSSR